MTDVRHTHMNDLGHAASRVSNGLRDEAITLEGWVGLEWWMRNNHVRGLLGHESLTRFLGDLANAIDRTRSGLVYDETKDEWGRP